MHECTRVSSGYRRTSEAAYIHQSLFTALLLPSAGLWLVLTYMDTNVHAHSELRTGVTPAAGCGETLVFPSILQKPASMFVCGSVSVTLFILCFFVLFPFLLLKSLSPDRVSHLPSPHFLYCMPVVQSWHRPRKFKCEMSLKLRQPYPSCLYLVSIPAGFCNILLQLFLNKSSSRMCRR